MDLVPIFGTPMIGAVYQLLVNTGWEAFNRWREGRKAELLPAPASLVLRGNLDNLRMDVTFKGIGQVFDDLDFLRDNYSEDGPFDIEDVVLIETLSRLRANLELLFGQHFTFKGEEGRPDSGSRVRIRQDVEGVEDHSEVIGSIGADKGRDVEVDQRVRNVTGSSKVVGYMRGEQ